MRLLLESPEHRYLLVADTHDPDGSIKPWPIPDPDRFVEAPCFYIKFPILLQRGLLRLALRRDLQTIIFLGNALYPATWLAAIVARLTGKRVLFWTHGWIERDHGLKLRIRCAFYRLAHGLLLYGHMAKMIALEAGFAPERLHVIYNSLDYDQQKRARAQVTPERIARIRRELFDDPNRPLLICTTRLTTVRRLDLLLEAMVLLRQQGRELNLLLVGDGPEQEPLARAAAEKQLAVKFYGACYDEQVLAELVMAANLSVSPGAIGLTAIHSLAFGTPVVTHDDPEQQGPEWEAIIPGRTGDLFQCNDVADLARAIEAWTRSELPDERVRQDCFRMVERFYNPQFQRLAIDRAVSGATADDLFWMKGDPVRQDHPRSASPTQGPT